LALAATAPANQKKNLIRAASGERGYTFYKGFRSNLATILNVPINPFIAAPPATRTQVKAAIGRACNHAPGKVEGNKGIGEGLLDYVTAHNVTAAEFISDPVALGRAGRRHFCDPYVLKIDGKKYIPFFDPRRENGLTVEAMRFVFSINHTHIRLLNSTEWGDVGFVIFQFENSRKGARKAIPHFDNGITFGPTGKSAGWSTRFIVFWTRFGALLNCPNSPSRARKETAPAGGSRGRLARQRSAASAPDYSKDRASALVPSTVS
jgi:hypothetical protein